MKKIALLLAIVILVSVPVNVLAATPRTLCVTPELTFNGTTARCGAVVSGDTMRDEIQMTVRLWKGSYNFKTWNVSGNGYIIFDETTTVWRGYTYVMTIDITFNGERQQRISIANECP